MRERPRVGRLAIFATNDDAFGKSLITVANPVKDRGINGVCSVGEAQLQHLSRCMFGNKLARRTFGHNLRLVHDDKAIAELLRLIHVVRCQNDCCAATFESLQRIP